MGAMAAIGLCTVLLLVQPQPTITQGPLGKPGESAPPATAAPADPVPAPAPQASAPKEVAPPATPPPAQTEPRPAPADGPAIDSGKRVAAFWVILPD